MPKNGTKTNLLHHLIVKLEQMGVKVFCFDLQYSESILVHDGNENYILLKKDLENTVKVAILKKYLELLQNER